MKILEEVNYPEQSYRSCSGVIYLAEKVGNLWIKNACKRVLEYGRYIYTVVKNMLEKGLDKIIDEDQRELNKNQILREENNA